MITSIKYDGRITLSITGPEKMKSYMTVLPEFANLMMVALGSLSRYAADTHRLDVDKSSNRWEYTAYYGD